MPGANFESDDDNFDAQDVAETLDEDKFSLDELSDERKTFEELPDVLDVTCDPADSEDDETAEPLDEALDETLAASDPVSLTRREDRSD